MTTGKRTAQLSGRARPPLLLSGSAPGFFLPLPVRPLDRLLPPLRFYIPPRPFPRRRRRRGAPQAGGSRYRSAHSPPRLAAPRDEVSFLSAAISLSSPPGGTHRVAAGGHPSSSSPSFPFLSLPLLLPLSVAARGAWFQTQPGTGWPTPAASRARLAGVLNALRCSAIHLAPSPSNTPKSPLPSRPGGGLAAPTHPSSAAQTFKTKAGLARGRKSDWEPRQPPRRAGEAPRLLLVRQRSRRGAGGCLAAGARRVECGARAPVSLSLPLCLPTSESRKLNCQLFHILPTR